MSETKQEKLERTKRERAEQDRKDDLRIKEWMRKYRIS